MSKRFKVALSFPGEHRSFVADVARSLSDRIGKKHILYDEYHEAEFARTDLDTYLQGLYRDESELIVVFLCADYENKRWCKLEWRAIRDLISTRDSASIMPIRFDRTQVSGLFAGDGYIEVRNRTGAAIADLIGKRLNLDSTPIDRLVGDLDASIQRGKLYGSQMAELVVGCCTPLAPFELSDDYKLEDLETAILSADALVQKADRLAGKLEGREAAAGSVSWVLVGLAKAVAPSRRLQTLVTSVTKRIMTIRWPVGREDELYNTVIWGTVADVEKLLVGYIDD